jgi:hypothetical protein
VVEALPGFGPEPHERQHPQRPWVRSTWRSSGHE